jgi:hypothetical protein
VVQPPADPAEVLSGPRPAGSAEVVQHTAGAR